MLSHPCALVLVAAARIDRPGFSNKPLHRWGRLLQAFRLSSKDVERIG